MIFVTVGTHEQLFNRLIEKVDDLKKEGVITEEVFMQTGFSDYVPRYCKWKKFISIKEMNAYMEKANIIICHGGPATFLKAIRLSKIPIVVPRQSKYHEHVNNHQLDFVKYIYSYNKNIIPVYDVNELGNIINNFSGITKKLNNSGLQDNNKLFNMKLNEVVSNLFKKEK